MTGIALDAAIPAIGGQVAQVALLKWLGARCATGRPAQGPVVHQHEIHGRSQVVCATVSSCDASSGSNAPAAVGWIHSRKDDLPAYVAELRVLLSKARSDLVRIRDERTT